MLVAKYLTSILFPITVEIVCIAGFVLFPEQIVYTNFVMYSIWIIYYRKEFFTIAYIKTKDIYVVITAHFIVSVLVNFPVVLIS